MVQLDWSFELRLALIRVLKVLPWSLWSRIHPCPIVCLLLNLVRFCVANCALQFMHSSLWMTLRIFRLAQWWRILLTSTLCGFLLPKSAMTEFKLSNAIWYLFPYFEARPRNDVIVCLLHLIGRPAIFSALIVWMAAYCEQDKEELVYIDGVWA